MFISSGLLLNYSKQIIKGKILPFRVLGLVQNLRMPE
jgi:hypothetical protein